MGFFFQVIIPLLHICFGHRTIVPRRWELAGNLAAALGWQPAGDLEGARMRGGLQRVMGDGGLQCTLDGRQRLAARAGWVMAACSMGWVAVASAHV
jgi:hypothetical protein